MSTEAVTNEAAEGITEVKSEVDQENTKHVVTAEGSADESSNNAAEAISPKKEAVANPSNENLYIRLRGLPYVVKEEEIRDFFNGLEIGKILSAPTRDGRPSGECYCQLNREEDIERAINEYNMKEINGRYIEIFELSASELSSLKRSGALTGDDRIIRLRGIPFSATKQDIEDFLAGLTCEEVVIGQTGGRPSGEAFIRLGTKEEASKALDLNRKTMGSRYIEVFRTNEQDLETHRDGGSRARSAPRPEYPGGPRSLMSLNVAPPGRDYDDYGGPVRSGGRGGNYRANPYEGGGRGSGRRGGSSANDGYGTAEYGWESRSRKGGRGGASGDDDFGSSTKAYIRGIPFNVSAHEIEDFFAPLKCVEIKVGYNTEGRPSGDATVEFASAEDFRRSFDKNRQYLGRRYVEIFSNRDVPPTMRGLTWQTIASNPHLRRAAQAQPAPPPPEDPYAHYQGTTGGAYDYYNYGSSQQTAPAAATYGASSGASGYGRGGTGAEYAASSYPSAAAGGGYSSYPSAAYGASAQPATGYGASTQPAAGYRGSVATAGYTASEAMSSYSTSAQYGASAAAGGQQSYDYGRSYPSAPAATYPSYEEYGASYRQPAPPPPRGAPAAPRGYGSGQY